MIYINIGTVHTHDCLCFPPKFLLVMGIAKKCHIIFERTFLNGDIVFLMEYQQKTNKPSVASHNDPTFKLA